jgi:hypothetical protein
VSGDSSRTSSAPGIGAGPIPLTLGHCGIFSGIDLGGSWWDPVGPVDIDHGDAINAATGVVTATAAVLLAILTIYGFAKGLMALNDLGNKTTAFNLSAIVAVLVAFATFNVQQLVGGDFNWPHLDPLPMLTFRKLFESSCSSRVRSHRYIGAYFSADTRVKTMRLGSSPRVQSCSRFR